MYVIDCSVAVKWFLPEPHAAAAFRIRASQQVLHVPELFQLEFGSAVLKRIRRRDISLDDGLRMLKEIRLVPMYRHSDASLFPRAFELASITQTSLYDCLYLAIAVDLAAVVVTADQRFVRSVADTDYAEHVLWVEDLPVA